MAQLADSCRRSHQETGHKTASPKCGWPEKKRPELCVTLTARILYGAKFPLAHFVDQYYYLGLLINFSDVINECRRLYPRAPDNDFVFVQDSAPSQRAKATQNCLQLTRMDTAFARFESARLLSLGYLARTCLLYRF